MYPLLTRTTLQSASRLHLIFISAAPQVTWDQAVEWVLEAVKPLGPEYCSIAERGLRQEGWVDAMENKVSLSKLPKVFDAASSRASGRARIAADATARTRSFACLLPLR